MRIRSVTIGTPMQHPLDEDHFAALEQFQGQARSRFEAAGLDVQTVRLATQPFPEILQEAGPSAAVPFARRLEALCRAAGIDYCSIGTVPTVELNVDPAYITIIPEVIRQTEMAFASVSVASPGGGINLRAIAQSAEVIAEIAHTTPDGFGNLRLAILANCEPGSPFFPVSYHEGAETRFAVATEAADLAVDAFAPAETLEEARDNLRSAIKDQAAAIGEVAHSLEAEFGFRFGGIDFSLAPFPDAARSIGQAIERLGVEAFGSSGTLFAVAFIKQAIREADFPRCGFSGVMLPVLEDATMARRSMEETFTLDSLLLYSTVCGTGLDTIPLPGDVTVDELSAILLDVATLSLVADKPLTARLMPIPGKKAGDLTTFDFPYFANARIMDIRDGGVHKIFAENAYFAACFL